MNDFLVSAVIAKQLLDRQLQCWELARNNYDALENVCARTVDCGTFQVKVQYNPARIVSTGAQTDRESQQTRPCFLCNDHLPDEQLRIPMLGEFQLLVNPYPIFRQHWTIPKVYHQPQRIKDNFAYMVEMMRTLSPFLVFYNGSFCGASAPEHFHFQVGCRGFLPLETDCDMVERELLFADETLGVSVLKSYGRGVIVLESDTSIRLLDALSDVYESLPMKEGEPEPGMNVVGWYESGNWRVCVFPRAKHRPSCYGTVGADCLLISPGAVDMGGVLITPRKEDYEKVTSACVRRIYQEVSLSDEAMLRFILNLKEKL